MASQNLSLISSLANFGLLLLMGLGVTRRVEILDKTKVNKDTCINDSANRTREFAEFRQEMRQFRQITEAQLQEIMKMFMELYKALPKRDED